MALSKEEAFKNNITKFYTLQAGTPTISATMPSLAGVAEGASGTATTNVAGRGLGSGTGRAGPTSEAPAALPVPPATPTAMPIGHYCCTGEPKSRKTPTDTRWYCSVFTDERDEERIESWKAKVGAGEASGVVKNLTGSKGGNLNMFCGPPGPNPDAPAVPPTNNLPRNGRRASGIFPLAPNKADYVVLSGAFF